MTLPIFEVTMEYTAWRNLSDDAHSPKYDLNEIKRSIWKLQKSEIQSCTNAFRQFKQNSIHMSL